MTAHAITRYPRADWRQQSGCDGHDSSLWFPHHGDHRAAQQALAICSTCPVRLDCLTVHLAERYGIWGGTTERERRRVRQQLGEGIPLETATAPLVRRRRLQVVT